MSSELPRCGSLSPVMALAIDFQGAVEHLGGKHPGNAQQQQAPLHGPLAISPAATTAAAAKKWTKKLLWLRMPSFTAAKGIAELAGPGTLEGGGGRGAGGGGWGAGVKPHGVESSRFQTIFGVQPSCGSHDYTIERSRKSPKVDNTEVLREIVNMVSNSASEPRAIERW